MKTNLEKKQRSTNLKKTTMSSGKLAVGVLAGIAVGVIAGILFAPEKGSRTRKNLVNKGEDYLDDIKDKFDVFFETITEKFENTHHEAEELLAKGKSKYEQARKELSRANA